MMNRIKEFREDILHAFIAKAKEIEGDIAELGPDEEGRDEKVNEMYSLVDIYKELEDTMQSFLRELGEI